MGNSLITYVISNLPLFLGVADTMELVSSQEYPCAILVKGRTDQSRVLP